MVGHEFPGIDHRRTPSPRCREGGLSRPCLSSSAPTTPAGTATRSSWPISWAIPASSSSTSPAPRPERLARIDRLLRIFRENVELLVHKTWVEKSEEKPKDRLLEDLVAFEREFRDGAVCPAFKRFVALANSIASLLFGHQSTAEDFLAYCFRIDPKFGLFFWYVGELEKQAREGAREGDKRTNELMTVETLLGVYVLSSF